MCGRYRLSRREQFIDEYFATEPTEEDWTPRYNIAPTQPVFAIRQNAKEPIRTLSMMRWGLIPSGAKDPTAAAIMINARAETAAAKPAFRDALKYRRCLIPADGFYEWQKTTNGKQPYCFEVNEGELFAFAGIWDCWTDPKGVAIETCSIITTTANTLMSDVHDRMPVILSSGDYDLWLDPGLNHIATARDLLQPFAASQMRSYPVSTRMHFVANDDEESARPILLENAPAQRLLF